MSRIESRRKFTFASLAAVLALALPAGAVFAQAAREVKVAVIVPLTGPWARNGELQVKGAQAAVEDINAAGGIKSLGGARMKLLVIDSGDSVEKARSAAQRLLADEPDLVGASGAFVSSFTLAVTEITERANLPFLTLSYADQITNRGFKNVFQTSLISSVQASQSLPLLMKLAADTTGKKPQSIGIIADNTASPASFTKSMREGGFEKEGLKLTLDEIYTPPVADATSLIQKLRNTRPNMLLMLSTNVPDSKLLLEKMSEMRMGKGTTPVVTSGGHMGAPELLKVVNKDILEGVMVLVANWGGKGQEALTESFKKRFNEPWMTQDSISTYGDMWIFKDAMEASRSADRRKVSEAIHAMDSTTGAAKFFPGGHLQFNEKGQRVGKDVVILQWRDGQPLTVYPPDLAVTKAIWPDPTRQK